MRLNERSILGIVLGSMILLSIISIAVTFGAGAMASSGTAGEWTIQTVDGSGDVGMFTSLALDSANKVHISYYDYGNHSLKYATNAGGYWYTTTVDSAGDVGMYSSIALDSEDKVHISYYDYTKTNLKYATNAAGYWNATTVDSSRYVGEHSSIVLDSEDKAHISYYDGRNGDLKYATNANGSWTTEVVDASGDVGLHSSIALDSADIVHISYYDFSNGDLKLATEAGSSWNTTIVDSSGDVGGDTSMAIDSTDHGHISYINLRNDDLKYATNVSGSWNSTTVDSYGDVGWYTSLALDSADKVHISYYNGSGFDLKYATNAAGAWSTSTVDSTGKVGEYTSIAVDSSGWSHISYFDQSNSDLKYATDSSNPAAPSNLMAKAGDAYVQLSWEEPSIPVSGTQVYDLFRGDELIWSGPSLSYNDTSVTNEVTYTYSVAARDDAGEMHNNSVTATPTSEATLPEVPLGLRANTGDGQVTLSWDAPSQSGGSAITGYKVYRGNSTGPLVPIATVSDTKYDDADLSNGQAYHFKISAISSIGESALTDEVVATPASTSSGGDVTLIAFIIGAVAIAGVSAGLIYRRKKK